MFKRLAEFRLVRLVQSYGMARGLQEALPANDNLPNGLQPGRPRRTKPRALACQWSLIDGGTRLGCRWQPEAPAQTALDDPESGRTNEQALDPQASRPAGLAAVTPCQV
jgi:hypothetical protein